MSLFDDLAADQRANRGKDLCSMARIKTHLSEEDRADLERALVEESGGTYRISGAVIARRLQGLLGEKSYNIKGQTVQRHRRGLCDCE